jgi:predicted ester cyclase
MALSRSQLYRRLKLLIRQSPVHYIRFIRLQKAKQLLAQTELSVGEVAFEVGFVNQSHFSKTFKSAFGLSPMDYKNSSLNGSDASEQSTTHKCDTAEKSKRFMLNYYREMHKALKQGPAALEIAMKKYIADEKLMNHIRFFQKSFPGYQLILEYMMAEDNQVFVKVSFTGKHVGQAEHIPPTHQEVKVPFALGYKIENEKITDFWAIADEMDFFEQLGLKREQVEVRKEKLQLS